MPLSRLRRKPVGSYTQTLVDVVGRPGSGRPDALALAWAHEIAWREYPGPDERQTLSDTAHRYGIPLQDLLKEHGHGRPPVVPARRPS